MTRARPGADLLVLAGMGVGGVAAIVAGAVGAAAADRAAYAVPYVSSGGLIGVALVAASACLLVLRARRRADALELARIAALTEAVNRRLAHGAPR